MALPTEGIEELASAAPVTVRGKCACARSSTAINSCAMHAGEPGHGDSAGARPPGANRTRPVPPIRHLFLPLRTQGARQPTAP